MQASPERNGPQIEALDRLTRLQSLTASLSEAVTSEQVADAILTQAATLLGACAGVVVRLSEDGSELVSLHTTGYSSDVVNALRRFPTDAPMPLCDAVRDRQPVFLASLAEQDARYAEIGRIGGVQAEGTLAAMPLVVRGKAIGGMDLRFPSERSFTEEDRAFLVTIAGLCAQALDRAQLYDTEKTARQRAERAEEALRKSEERFARFMQHLPGLAWIKDKRGRYVYANDAAMKAFGKPRRDLYGRTDEEIFPAETAARFRENDQKALANKTGVRVVETLEHDDGVLHYSLVSKFPIPGPDEEVTLVGGMAIDITEDMRTRTVLEESEERFRATFEQAAVGLAHVGPDGRWLRVNRKLCDIVGYQPDELLAGTFQDITHPDDVEADLAQARRLLAGEIETYSLEKRYFHKDGPIIWICLTASLVRTPQGQPKYFISVVEDITEEKQVRDALRENEGRLRTLSNNLPQGAIYQVIGDLQGRRRFLYISAGVEWLFGVTPAEALANADALYGLIHEEDRSRVVVAEEIALREQSLYDCEFRARTRSGDLRWFHCRSAPRHLAMGEVIWEGVLLDVTARKNAETELARLASESQKRRRLYEAALSNTPDLVYVFDLDHRFAYANEGLLRMWGRTWDEAIGKNCLELGYEPWHAAMHDREIEQVVATKQPIKGEVPFTGTFGRRIYEYIFVPVLGENGEVEAVAGTTRDVTDRKVQEERLRDADRRKDEFLAMLAHELRNPLAPIRNAAQIFRLLGPADPNLQRARDMIERQVQHLTRLVDDLLDVSRITRGKITLHKETADLATVIARAVETSRPLIDSRRQDLTVTFPRESLRVEADVTRLAQVISNLLNNAAKFTHEGGHIRLIVETLQGKALVRVQDDGVGITAELLPHVFDLFTQGDRSLARTEGGLGIGLTLVKSLVEMHGGSVEARSAGPGRGSEFIVRLSTRETKPASQTEDGEGKRPVPPPSPPRRILVVDDNVDAAESMTMMLRVWGHDVRTAHDGLAALKTAELFRPEIVLLDIGLPRMDGYEVARRLRELAGMRDALLVALTGYGQEEDQRQAKEAGFNDHLTKPANLTALQELLARSWLPSS